CRGGCSIPSRRRNRCAAITEHVDLTGAAGQMRVLDTLSSICVARPVKVENTCLLKPPVMMVSGLPPLFQIDCRTFLSWPSLKLRAVPSVRAPVPSAAEGSAPEAPFEVLVLSHDSTVAVLRAVESLPVTLAWLVPTRIDSMSRLSSMPLSISWYSS